MYTVRIPLKAPSHIRIGEDRAVVTADAISYELKYDGHFHVLTAQGLQSMCDAEGFIRRLECGPAWLLLTVGIPVEAELKPQQIKYYDDPETVGANFSRSVGGAMPGPIDAFIGGNQAAIYPSSKRVRVATAFPLSGHSSLPADKALALVLDGVKKSGSDQLPTDKKLGTALALYSAYFTEHSNKARFLTLIMALEAMASPVAKADAALALLRRWGDELKSLRKDTSLTDDDRSSLDALERELIFRSEDSIRSQIKKLVLWIMSGDQSASALAREAVRLYDLRSTLVHEGYLDQAQLNQATSDAKVLVERCLKARLLQVIEPQA